MTKKLYSRICRDVTTKSAIRIWFDFFWPKIPSYCRVFNKLELRNILIEQARQHFPVPLFRRIVTDITGPVRFRTGFQTYHPINRGWQKFL